MVQKLPRVIVDENLSRRLLVWLTVICPGSQHVVQANLQQVQDSDIWSFAKTNEFCILTKDTDFRFMSVANGCPPKVIHLMCGNKSTDYIISLLNRKSAVIQDFLFNEDQCYLEIG